MKAIQRPLCAQASPGHHHQPPDASDPRPHDTQGHSRSDVLSVCSLCARRGGAATADSFAIFVASLSPPSSSMDHITGRDESTPNLAGAYFSHNVPLPEASVGTPIGIRRLNSEASQHNRRDSTHSAGLWIDREPSDIEAFVLIKLHRT